MAANPRLKWTNHKLHQNALFNIIRLRAPVFYEQIVNEAQPSWLSLVENKGE